MRTRSAEKKGFTLVEVIVVLVMLVVLAAATYGSFRTFFTRSEQDARDLNARILFMAAQSALTHTYANDPDSATALSNGAAPVTFASITPQTDSEEWILERTLNSNNIVSLSSNGGSGTALLSLLDAYVDDKTVLKNNILIEFNKETGNVLACFYSDETTLSHGNTGYDVYTRDASSLRDGLVGYYGVEYTGTRAARQVVEEAQQEPQTLSAWLVDYDGAQTNGNNINAGKNYGLLALECALPEVTPLDTVYTVQLSSSNGNTWSITLGGSQAQVQISSLGTNMKTALENPITYQDGGQNQQAVVFRNVQPCADGRTLIVIVLDSQVAGAGIRDLYPDVDEGYLVATISGESLSTGQTYDTATSNYEHALYSDVNEAGTAYVSSVRHLNNVRCTPAGHFEQTCDLTMVDYNSDVFAMPAIGLGSGGSQNTSFTGEYDGKNYEISGLTSPASSTYAGLFWTLAGGSRVENVRLLSFSLKGSSRAGGIAATNNGTINKCTVYSEATATGINYSIDATGSNGVAGGIAAVNGGTIQSCYVGANIRAVSKAGGIAGVSSGNINYCEVATAFAASVGEMSGNLVGDPYFGAESGFTYDYGEQSGIYAMDNNQRWVLVTGATASENNRITTGLAGGIVGEQTDGQVTYCTNAAHVGANQGVAGGLVGCLYLDSRTDIGVTMSYNAGVVDATLYAGGLIGQLFTGTVTICYNTAPVNCFITATQMRNNCYLPAQTVHGTENAGGLAGRVNQDTGMSYCYSASYVYAGANTPFAGAFGKVATDSSVQISNCYFLRNALNTSARYSPFNGDPYEHFLSGAECVRILAKKDLMRTSINSDLAVYLNADNSNSGVGPRFRINSGMDGNSTLPYYFPAFDVNTSVCQLGRFFQRTPYYPVLQEYGRIELSMDSDYLYATCYVLEADATVQLTINNGLFIRRDYVFTLSSTISKDEENASGLTMSASGLFFTITLQGITGTKTTLGTSDDMYALGYTQKYVLAIPRSQPTVLVWYPNTVSGSIMGPSVGSSSLLWWETSERNWN